MVLQSGDDKVLENNHRRNPRKYLLVGFQFFADHRLYLVDDGKKKTGDNGDAYDHHDHPEFITCVNII